MIITVMYRMYFKQQGGIRMGIYLNPGNEQFSVSVNSELYVDKTELIKYTNSRIGKDRPLICSSRPRRFGKTMAVTMLSAYYSKGCHSEKLFAELKISQNEFFRVHLNKYNVIFLDIQWMYGNALEEMKRKSSMKVVSYIQEQVITELREEYPEIVQDTDISLPSVLAKVNAMTNLSLSLMSGIACFGKTKIMKVSKRNILIY